MLSISKLFLTVLSMVSSDNLQRVKVEYECNKAAHLFLSVYEGKEKITENIEIALDSGEGYIYIMLPLQNKEICATAVLTDISGKTVKEASFIWKQPRKWTFYTMLSSHTDIGLHNSQYIQRYNSSQFIDDAIKLCDETENRKNNDKYRYTMEGVWFWNNYGMDRGKSAAEMIADNYIKKDKIGICCGIAGNHTQVFGLEEMCRSAYEKKRLFDEWGLESETMSMIDNNGLSMSLIQPFSEAGYKNIIFSPNQWNPLPSTVWNMDRTKSGYYWNCDAGGGGSRIDIRYDSKLPMVFFWEDENGNRILVWGTPQYDNGGSAFGFDRYREYSPTIVNEMEYAVGEQITKLEKKYPYDIWLLTCYGDDQKPCMNITNTFEEWNSKWKYPQFRTLGNPDKPFNILREKYGDKIPVLSGDITGGWYQHPIAAAELLADKFEADRLLPTAEKWAVIASLIDSSYGYPTVEFRRAWDYLLYNDEHSYGTSGYQGRRVYETWMQHRDWIEKAKKTADDEIQKALKAIASEISSNTEKCIVFNPTLLERTELIEEEEGYKISSIPPMGYTSFARCELIPYNRTVQKCSEPPVIENRYYRIEFFKNGSMKSIFDKELNIELIDTENNFNANELVYTNDNHKTFYTPDNAEYEIITEKEKTTVIIKTYEEHLRAEIIQAVTLLNFEKRIDIENKLYHARDMINNNRYYRYLYYAFPFMVKNAKRFCHLNGSVAEYAKSTTAHGTDVYMAVNEWCCSENKDFGVALMMLDSSLVEFDHIHPDKTDFGNTGDGSQMFVYLANDWLQMHCTGGSHLNYRFRYSITSYKGGYKSAGVPPIAERIANPIYTVSIKEQTGKLYKPAQSFLVTDSPLRLLTLKRADNGKGIIARFYGEDAPINSLTLLNKKTSLNRNTVDERSYNGSESSGFITYRLGEECIIIREREIETFNPKNDEMAPIGSVYTGLITKPKAACGENDGQLYLLWGRSTEKDFSHYKLYRSESPDFKANADTFIADVYPEEYCVGRYVDTELKHHTCYHYRVCAVNKNGVSGEMSEVFSAFTKEEKE